MSYRRHVDHQQQESERRWIERHAQQLWKMGLAPSVLADYDHWLDFLDNGYLDHHEDPTRFHFEQLSREQLVELREFLEAEYGLEDRPPPLLGWLRRRLSTEK